MLEAANTLGAARSQVRRGPPLATLAVGPPGAGCCRAVPPGTLQECSVCWSMWWATAGQVAYFYILLTR